ncbi:hypothetical protein KC318_g14509 [Hortaea werneckii]|nr:hypothetical protein KC334_g14650 [Hortaea werneckii]KAI7540109.1 hypothetical protein KC316_g15591 [Hortaea werneckii]KAI7653040.1 hypothetical protein KC318_g14509 [Hortaea werneckii]
MDPTCPTVPTATVTVPAPCEPMTYVGLGAYTGADCSRAPLGNSERVNWDLIEIGIANGTTPRCYPFDEAVLSFAYFIYGPRLAEDECEMEFYESDDCTDLVTLGVDLAKYSARCYNFGRTTRSLKVSCGGGPGSHY